MNCPISGKSLRVLLFCLGMMMVPGLLFAQSTEPKASGHSVFVVKPVVPWCPPILLRMYPSSQAVRTALQGNKMVKVRLTSLPSGALLLLNGRVVGRTPLELVATPGQLKVELRLKGFRPFKKNLKLAPKTPNSLQWKLVKDATTSKPPKPQTRPPVRRVKVFLPSGTRKTTRRSEPILSRKEPRQPPVRRVVKKAAKELKCLPTDLASCPSADACAKKDALGCAKLGMYRLALAKDKKALKRVYETFVHACGLGSGLGCAYWGRFLYRGTVGKRNRKAARGILKKACEQASGEGCYWFAWVAHRRSRKKRRLWIQKARTLWGAACKKQDAFACERLARLAQRGWGGKRDRKLADESYRKACSLGRRKSCYRTAVRLYYAKGKKRDDQKLLHYGVRACSMKQLQGCDLMGRVFQYGKGAKKSPLKAIFFYGQASQRSQHQGLRLLNKVCRKSSEGVCQGLARLHCRPMTQKEKPTSMPTGTVRACEQGYIRSCQLFCHPKNSRYVRIRRIPRKKRPSGLVIEPLTPSKSNKPAFDPTKLYPIIARKQRGSQSCYERELKQNPTLAGKLTLRLTIETTGRVSAIEVEENTLNSRVAKCVIRYAKRWRLPKPANKVTIVLPMVFSPQN